MRRDRIAVQHDGYVIRASALLDIIGAIVQAETTWQSTEHRPPLS
jgi:hypothetical protein